MARYGCLVIGTILALIILFVIVYFWSGWLNRPVGHSIATTESLLFLDGRGLEPAPYLKGGEGLPPFILSPSKDHPTPL